MYEGAIRIPAAEAGVDGGLRGFAWAELVARLAAARDLRGELGPGRPPGASSFAPEAARLVRQADGEDDVNLEALAHGKARGRKSVAPASTAAGCDRETR
jgi:hypothetical protein